MVSGKESWGFLPLPLFVAFGASRLRELAHGFLDEEEEVQIPNHVHPGGADGGPLRERGPLLQGPAAGWRGLRQLIVQVRRWLGQSRLLGRGGAKRHLATWQVWERSLGAQRVLKVGVCLGQVCTRQVGAERPGRSGPAGSQWVPAPLCRGSVLQPALGALLAACWSSIPQTCLRRARWVCAVRG